MRQIGKVLCVVLLVLCLGACALSGARQTHFGKETRPSSTEEVKLLGLTFPYEVYKFRRVTLNEFPEAELGYGVGYQGPRDTGVTAVIFVYDLGLKDLPADLESVPFTKELEETIRTYEKMNGRLLSRSNWMKKNNDQLGFSTVLFEEKSFSGNNYVYLFLTSWQGRFVKLSVQGQDMMNTMILGQFFANDVGGILWPGAKS